MRQHSDDGETKGGSRGSLRLDSEAHDLAGRQRGRPRSPIASERGRSEFTLVGGHPAGGTHGSVEGDDAGGRLVAWVVAPDEDAAAAGGGPGCGKHEAVAVELDATLAGLEPERLPDPQGARRQKEIF